MSNYTKTMTARMGMSEPQDLFDALNQLEFELCKILGLEWTEIKWGDIQSAVQELKNQVDK